MFEELEKINYRPKPFEYYTAEELWADEYTSKKMLQFHLDESVDISSRNIKFIERSVEWITSYFGVNKTKSIADFGCGPGLYTTRLAQKGAMVTGIDFSRSSINYAQNTARDNGLEIDYIRQNYLTFETDKKIDLIIMIMCDFCALSPKQRKELLQKFYKLLKHDGSILLDVYSLKVFDEKVEQSSYKAESLNGFWSPEKHYIFLNTFKYNDEKVILDKYTIVEKGRIKTVYNWLQYYSRESLTDEFEKNGFKVKNMYSDAAGSNYNHNSSEMAIVAQKAI